MSNSSIGPYQVLQDTHWKRGVSYPSTEMQSVYSTVPVDWAIQVRADLRVIAMKGYSTQPKALRVKSHHQIQFSVIHRTLKIFVHYYNKGS